MANSITPGGTSRTIFGITTGDIETSGTLTGSSIIGNGKNITNINANNITYGNISLARGGTGNSIFINNALIFNSNNKLINDTNLLWEANILKINNRDFLSDTSNYVKSTSNNLSNLVNNRTDILSESIISNINNINIKNLNVSNYVLSTSNTLSYLIKTERANSVISPATTNKLGGVQIGDGLYINKSGIISVMPEITYAILPTVNNTTLSFIPIPDTFYNVCKFLYNSSIGTTFDRKNSSLLILPIWYKFTNNIITNRVNNSGSLGTLTNLELYGDITIAPSTEAHLNIENTPLNSTYLQLNCTTSIPTFCKFENNFDINKIFRPITNTCFTMSFWLKINFNSNEIIIIEFSNSIENNLRKLSINYVNNNLKFFIYKINEPIIIIPNIYTSLWYHILWSMEWVIDKFKIIIYINGIQIATQNITDRIMIDYLYNFGFDNYIKNTISSADNIYNYNFSISDFKIYNCILTSEEIDELYNTNYYTKYLVDFKDTENICDILAYGGGGGGSFNFGGGAGKLVFVNDANISGGIKTIKIGRGGSGYNVDNNQFSQKGIETTFEQLIADGGGVNISLLLNKDGGSGSGKYGNITNFNITNNLKTFLGNTSNIYSYGFIGGEYGGGGAGSAGVFLNGGYGLYELNINNQNTDFYNYYNFNSNINFKNYFYLDNSDIGELYNDNIYITCGGSGMSIGNNLKGNTSIGYNSINSGCGGNSGENGKNGALIIRILIKRDRKILPKYINETSNYILNSSNNIIGFVKNIPSWTKGINNNIYYNSGNIGIGIEPNNYMFEVASINQLNVITLETGSYGIHTSNNSNIIVTNSINNNNICAKFNSSIWTTGNVISSSDERIKTNICDLEDDKALQMILNIQPKTYNYIDMRGRNNNSNIYGFIAQQIKDVIPDAVKIQSEFIPNILLLADYNLAKNIIILPNEIINIAEIINMNANSNTPPKIKCYDMYDNILIVEVIELISNNSLKIKNIKYNSNKIFVYGTEVKDFHALNKEYINTLNVCAVQELYRKIVLQKAEITDLNEKINVLLNYIDLSKIITLQDEISELRSRFDLLLNYIDLNK
jgi:hypothetical protein